MRKLILALMLSLSCSTCLAMSNPMAEQPSVMAAEKAADFMALTVNPGTGYQLEKVYLINRSVIELSYNNNRNQRMTIRTAMNNGTNHNISGIYSDKWVSVDIIGDMDMKVANLPNHTSAAIWYTPAMCYSVVVENIEPRDFNTISTALYSSMLDTYYTKESRQAAPAANT